MTERPPAVSVVLPTYNRAGTIRLAVESVLRQSFADFELIVVDDCSSDGTVGLLEGLGDPRLRVLRHERNRGGSAARNTGVGAARAPYVAFQDSDDEWLPTKLEKQMARLGQGGFIGSYCGMIVLNSPLETGKPQGRAPRVRYVPAKRDIPVEGEIVFSLLAQSLISTQTFVVSREALLASGAFDESLRALQDWDCVLRVARRGPIALVDEPLVIQRFSADSLSRSSENRLASRIRIFEKNGDLLESRPDLYVNHCYAIAGGHSGFGRYREALAWLRKGLRKQPFRGRVLLNYLRIATLARLYPERG